MPATERLSTLKFLSQLLAAASANEIATFDDGALYSEQGVKGVLDLLVKSWEEAEELNNIQLASDLLGIYCDLGVTPGTNQHDLFAARLRQLQPGYLGVTNPYYQEFRVSEGMSEEVLTTPVQKKLALEAAKILFSAA